MASPSTSSPFSTKTAAAWGSFARVEPVRRKREAETWKMERQILAAKLEAELEEESTSVTKKDKIKDEPVIGWETRRIKVNGEKFLVEYLTVDGKLHFEKRHPENHVFERSYSAKNDYLNLWREENAPAPAAPAPIAPAPSSAATKASRYFSKDKEDEEKEGEEREIEEQKSEEQKGEEKKGEEKEGGDRESSETTDTSLPFDDSPPPEGLGHPAFDGDASKPVVRLAPPKATVNLPRGVAPVQPVVHRAAPPPTDQHRTVVNKIHDLFKKERVTTVTSASKDALEVAPGAAVISLPGTTAVVVVAHVVDSTTKPTDEDLFESPAFASKPTVSMSKLPHLNHQFGYQHEIELMMPWEAEVLDVSTVTGEEELFVRDYKVKYRVWARMPYSNRGTFAEHIPGSTSPPRTSTKTRRPMPTKGNSNNGSNNGNNSARRIPAQFGGQQPSRNNYNNVRSSGSGSSWTVNNKRPSTGAQ